MGPSEYGTRAESGRLSRQELAASTGDSHSGKALCSSSLSAALSDSPTQSPSLRSCCACALYRIATPSQCDHEWVCSSTRSDDVCAAAQAGFRAGGEGEGDEAARPMLALLFSISPTNSTRSCCGPPSARARRSSTSIPSKLRLFARPLARALIYAACSVAPPAAAAWS